MNQLARILQAMKRYGTLNIRQGSAQRSYDLKRMKQGLGADRAREARARKLEEKRR